MNKGTHLLIKFIPSDKEVLPIQFMFNPSTFYKTFVQHIDTCKGECIDISHTSLIFHRGLAEIAEPVGSQEVVAIPTNARC